MHNPMVGRITDTYNLRRKHPVFQTVQPHRGIDLGAPIGTKPWDYIGADVRAAYGGVVEEVCANWQSGWGAIWGRSGDGVFVRNPDGEAQYYGHLSRVDVRKGQRVTEGQVIGGMGVSGNVTGPHLHFEIHNKGSGRSNNWTNTRDPMADFRAAGITPGQDAATLNPAASKPTPAKDWFDMATEADLQAAFLNAQITVQRSGKPATITVRQALQNSDSSANAIYGTGLQNAGKIAALENTVEQLATGTGVAIDYEKVKAASKAGTQEAIAAGIEVEGTVELKQKEN